MMHNHKCVRDETILPPLGRHIAASDIHSIHSYRWIVTALHQLNNVEFRAPMATRTDI